MFVKIKTKDQYANIRFEVCGFGAMAMNGLPITTD